MVIDNFELLASLASCGAGSLFLGKCGSQLWVRLLGCIALIGVLSLSGFYLAADYFTGAGIDYSVVYHLEYGLHGAGFQEYAGMIGAICLLVILSLAAALGLWKWSATTLEGKYSRSGTTCGVLLLLTALAVNPASADLLKLFGPGGIRGGPVELKGFLGEHYYVPQLQRPGLAKNLVYVYVESVERTYLDESLFPGLAPGLKELEAQSLTFTDIRQVHGTGWTIAGKTASQCGIPLVTPSHGNSMSGMDLFLPGATCLGGLLRGEGYRLVYMGGASLEFAGKGKFYETHGFDEVRGLDELAPQLEDPRYKSSWGLYDDSLFALAEQRLEQLAEQQTPFGLFLLTLDTHHPRGHPSKSCEGVTYGDGSNPILNAVRCTDLLVSRFVEAIRQSTFGHKTLIVVSSDHLALRNTAWDQLNSGQRRNLFFILDASAERSEAVGRPGSLLDVGPTLLQRLGYRVSRLGLGRSLLAEEPTLVEAVEDVDGLLWELSADLSRFWEFPQLDRGVLVDAENRQLRFGQRMVKAPALVLLDDAGTVEEVRFDFTGDIRLPSYVAELSSEQAIIWVDSCRNVSVLAIDEQVDPASEMCLFFGRLGGAAHVLESVVDWTYLGSSDISRIVSQSERSQSLHQQRSRLLQALAER